MNIKRKLLSLVSPKNLERTAVCSNVIIISAGGIGDTILFSLVFSRFKELVHDNETITIEPMKTFPIIKDLVTDVSWNYEQNKKIKPFKPKPREKDGNHYMMQRDVDRIQEFRKCIECYLCQNVCHVLRDNEKKQKFIGPRFFLRLASLEMHPLDQEDRIESIKEDFGSGMCNITRCCTDVCPEHIQITDNSIIPLKERVVDRYYDPIQKIFKKIFKK